MAALSEGDRLIHRYRTNQGRAFRLPRFHRRPLLKSRPPSSRHKRPWPPPGKTASSAGFPPALRHRFFQNSTAGEIPWAARPGDRRHTAERPPCPHNAPRCFSPPRPQRSRRRFGGFLRPPGKIAYRTGRIQTRSAPEPGMCQNTGSPHKCPPGTPPSRRPESDFQNTPRWGSPHTGTPSCRSAFRRGPRRRRSGPPAHAPPPGRPAPCRGWPKDWGSSRKTPGPPARRCSAPVPRPGRPVKPGAAARPPPPSDSSPPAPPSGPPPRRHCGSKRRWLYPRRPRPPPPGSGDCRRECGRDGRNRHRRNCRYILGPSRLPGFFPAKEAAPGGISPKNHPARQSWSTGTPPAPGPAGRIRYPGH